MNTTDNTTTPPRLYAVELTITFRLEVEATSPEEALEEARGCAINSGDPDTERETVRDADTGALILDQQG